MAQGYPANVTTRPHWGGANSDVDQHLELYQNLVDSAFQYTQRFSAWSTQRSTANQSNNIRIDRLGTSQVKGRKAGGDIDSQRVTSDKLNVIVECMMYIRNPIDWMDDWTAPDFLRDMARNNGTAFGVAYDEAHIIRLQKARTWTAPAHLKDAFHDGIAYQVSLKDEPTDITEMTANADAIVLAHAAIVEEFVNRHIPLGNILTAVTPKVYTELQYSSRLSNKDFSTGNGDFADRRVLRMNGVQVVELSTFPKKVGTNHILSTTTNNNAFDVTAADLKCEVIVFDKTLSLVTVTAKPYTASKWTDNKDMVDVLDCYTMYTIDVRRPDTVGVLEVTRA